MMPNADEALSASAQSKMNIKYILDEHGEPKLEPDILRWARWFETADRRVAVDTIGQYKVSTVFLGLDHNFSEGPPLLWETMIFGRGKLNLYMRRYETKDEAVVGHSETIEMVRLNVLGTVPKEVL